MRSQGAVTARAVGVMRAVDAEIRRARSNQASLDDVVRLLPRGEAVSVAGFRAVAERVAGRPLMSLPKP